VVTIALLFVVADVYQRGIAPDDIETFNIDGRNNPVTWFHAIVLAGAAFSALGVALTTFDGARRLVWLVLGLGIAFFSMDKAIAIHERVGSKIEDWLALPQDGGRIAWQVAWSPILLVVAAALLIGVSQSNRRTQLWAFGLLLAGGAKLVLEGLTFFAVRYLDATERTGWFYGIEVNVEETVQLLGFACLFAGFAQLFVDRLWALARGELDVLEAVHARERLSVSVFSRRSRAISATKAASGSPAHQAKPVALLPTRGTRSRR
jgi:hypothetical protein